MTDESDFEPSIEDGAAKFPDCMATVFDVFVFSHQEATKVAATLENNSQTIKVVERVIEFLKSAKDLDEQDVLEVEELLKGELEVVQFAERSRSAVISL